MTSLGHAEDNLSTGSIVLNSAVGSTTETMAIMSADGNIYLYWPAIEACAAVPKCRVHAYALIFLSIRDGTWKPIGR